VKDLYQILGLPRTATADEIKRAYRRLASQHHPDRGGDTARFQELQQAYEVLGDPQRRAQYDRPQPHMQENWGAAGGFQDIFDVFRRGGNWGDFINQQRQTQRRGHVRLELWIGLDDVARGGRRTVTIGTSTGVNAVDIEIPLAVDDGDHVQYAGLAPGGQDLVVTYRVTAHTVWTRSGLDLTMTKTLPVWDLILGSELKITDIHGAELTARVPAMTQPGTRLRLRDRGLRTAQGKTGDVFVQIQASLPDTVAPEILAAIQQYRQ